MNKYEAAGLIIKLTWWIIQMGTLGWAFLYGIQVFIGFIQTYWGRETQ